MANLKNLSFAVGAVVFFGAFVLSGGTQEARIHRETPLFDFEEGFDVNAAESLGDASIEISSDALGRRLRVITSHLEESPGVTLHASDGHWNLERHRAIEVEVHNPASRAAWVYGSVSSDGVDGCSENVGHVRVPAGQTRTLQILFRRIPPEEGSALERKFIGMRGLPGGYVQHWCRVDPAKITHLRIFLPESTVDQVIEIDNARAVGAYDPPGEALLEEGFFPFIDEYGQYKFKEWPGKIHSDADLAEARRREEADLARNPGAVTWNRYGGWRTGPQLEATGYFRIEKYQGRWWFVDPEGRLFWSHGIDCVRPGNAETPLLDREHYFEALPDEVSPLAQFYGEQPSASRGYYQNRSTRTFNFTGANLFRKYGEEWAARFARLSHRRLRSWGINTIGNWSSEEIYLQRRTPYVVNIGFSSREIEGSAGTWRKFPDVFDDSFRKNLRDRLIEEKGKSIGDPWCLGYFVGNELTWGGEQYLALAALQSPAEQPAKQALVSDLRSKYSNIGRLNEQWETSYGSWDELLESREGPDPERAAPDLKAFYARLSDVYFRTIREEIKRAAPDNLYLGCRFSSSNAVAVRASARFCDVVSFNKYERSLAHFSLPEGVDRPVIIGEFHFGALDRGKLHTGLRSVADQQERGEAYRHYVESALLHHNIVGTHWFQYGDQATTGRFDGENYQIGFVTMCDSPYAETIRASRAVGYDLYRFRIDGGSE